MNWFKPIPVAPWEVIDAYPENNTYTGWFCYIADLSSVSRDEFFDKVSDFLYEHSHPPIETAIQSATARYNVGVHLGLIPPPKLQFKRRHYA
jgi:hypothetical protein